MGQTRSNPAGELAWELSQLLQELLGPGHPVVATTLHNLALACDGAGQEERARWLWKEARAVVPSVADVTDAAVGRSGESPALAGNVSPEERP